MTEPLKPDDQWPDELPPEAAQPRRVHEAPNFDPSAEMFVGLGSHFTELLGSLKQKVSGLGAYPPRRVALISGLTVEALETRINHFLTSGVEIVTVSTRIFRIGNELVKEIHYREKAKLIAKQLIVNKETGEQGVRSHYDDGSFNDAFGVEIPPELKTFEDLAAENNTDAGPAAE